MKAADWASIPADRRTPMRSAIFAQCFGMLSQQMISGGILLLYLNAMGMKPAVILIVLNLTPFLASFMSIPVAWGADRVGIKRFGNWGNFLMITGLSFIIGGAFLRDVQPEYVLPVIITGLIIHMVGASFFNTGWFSLLSHIVPNEFTGRFFGVIRFSWQIVSLSFFILSAFFFSARTPIWIYQTVLLLGGISVGCRYFFYKHIPGAPPAESKPLNLIHSVKSALKLDSFAPYLAYLLLLVCVTSNGQDMLRLSAIRGCGLGDNQILFLTVGSMLGSLAAFKFMGRVIDRLGPRRVFLLCHIGFSVALLSFPARVIFHLPPLAAGIFTSMILGLTSSTLGLTTTSQSFQICRGAQRTIAYALVSATQSMGSGLSGFALAGLLSHMGTAVPGGNPFDLILIGLGAFVLVQIVGLRLLADKRERVGQAVAEPAVS
jgi:MFS family permease